MLRRCKGNNSAASSYFFTIGTGPLLLVSSFLYVMLLNSEYDNYVLCFTKNYHHTQIENVGKTKLITLFKWISFHSIILWLLKQLKLQVVDRKVSGFKFQHHHAATPVPLRKALIMADPAISL